MEFDPIQRSCPACGAQAIVVNAFSSTYGFMSLPGINHSLCSHCETCFVNPLPTNEALEAFYLSEATESTVEREILEASISRYSDPHKRAYFMEHRIEPLASLLHPGARVLDVGCGAGVFVKFMRDAGFEAKGVDLSLASIEAGRAHLGLGNHLRQGQWFDVEEGSFDAITAWTLCEHLKDPGEFLRGAYRRLAPRGLLLLEFPTVDSMLFKHLSRDFFWVMPPYHLTLFSHRGLETLLSQSGFEVVLRHQMPRNWNFMASLAKKLGLEAGEIAKRDQDFGRLMELADRVFDDIALEQQASSVSQVICRKRES